MTTAAQNTALFAALTGLVSGRVYPVMFPQQPLPVWPAIRYTPAGGTTHSTSCGTSDEDDPAVQIDCVAETFDGAVTLAASARTALEGITLCPVLADSPALYEFDAETRTWRSLQRFTFYPAPAA